MPTFLQPPKPGRPKRNPIDVLRTKVWFYAVKARSGLPSAYAIELAIEPSIVKHKEAGVVRPRKWDGYQTGLRVPRRMVGKPYSVDIADQNYPVLRPTLIRLFGLCCVGISSIRDGLTIS